MKDKASVIQTERLQLRSFEEKDLEAAIRIFVNDEVKQTYMLPDFPDCEAAQKLFDRLRQLSLEKDRFVYGIYRDDILVGFMNDVERKDTTIELGYVIHPDHKNQGYATEALRAAIEELFRIGHTVVKTGAFQQNAASIRVMQKSGMTLTDETEDLQYRGKIHTCVYYEITK
jgi:RimJ/RimL family protein N-acetyltransferase